MKEITALLFAASLMAMCIRCTSTTDPNSNLFTEAEIDTTLHIHVIEENGLVIYTIDKYNTTVVRIPRISSYLYFYRPVKSLEQIADEGGYSLVVNASYFDGSYDDTVAHTGLKCTPAGFLKINDSIYSNLKDDKQLSRLFAYDSKSNVVNYFGVNELDKTTPYGLVVQTGPQIIWKNEIDTAGINASINGNFQRVRTAFASVDGNLLYIVLAFTSVTYPGVRLADLGRMLRSTGIFRKELNIVNFDGGGSTSLYIRNHPELCWQPYAVKPLLICVK